jgi:uncharacterized RDD family membrane protein YckC
MSNIPPPPPPPGFGAPPPPPFDPSNPGYFSGGTTPAEWWKRLVARIIDGILLAIVTSILGLGTFKRGVDGTGFSYNGAGALGALVVGLVYFGVMHGLRGQSVGKMALKIKVIDKATGNKPDMAKAFIRALVDQILWITCIGGLLDGLWPLWDSQKQALHDKAVGTLVVDA